MNELRRTLNLTELVFYGMGSMIGAGIYSIIGAAAHAAGSDLWVSFILASIAALITVASYAELISMYPKAGAEYRFLKKSLPNYPIFSFMAGYLIALNASATSATVAIAFSGYLNFFITIPSFFIAFLLLFICTLINISGIRQSTGLSILLIIIEISGLLIIIWSGIEKNILKEISITTIPNNLSVYFLPPHLYFLFTLDLKMSQIFLKKQ